MKKKTLILSVLAIFMTLVFTACSGQTKTVKQTVAAWLTEGNSKVYATVDVSDGYSAEFASGAIYLYDGKTDDKDADAMCITLSENVYDEYMKEAEENNMKKLDDCVYYETEEGAQYLFEREGVFMKLTVYDRSKAEDVYKRLTFKKDSTN